MARQMVGLFGVCQSASWTLGQFCIVAHGVESMAQVLAQFLTLSLNVGLATRKIDKHRIRNCFASSNS